MSRFAEHLTWLIDQAADGRRADTDELWSLLYERLDQNRSLTDAVWRVYVTKPYVTHREDA